MVREYNDLCVPLWILGSVVAPLSGRGGRLERNRLNVKSTLATSESNLGRKQTN